MENKKDCRAAAGGEHMEKLQTRVETQHAFFQTGVTRTAQFRLSALRRLRRAVTEN